MNRHTSTISHHHVTMHHHPSSILPSIVLASNCDWSSTSWSWVHDINRDGKLPIYTSKSKRFINRKHIVELERKQGHTVTGGLGGHHQVRKHDMQIFQQLITAWNGMEFPGSRFLRSSLSILFYKSKGIPLYQKTWLEIHTSCLEGFESCSNAY